MLEFVDALSTLGVFEHRQRGEPSVDMATNQPIPTQWLDAFQGRSLRTVATAADITVGRLQRFLRGSPVAEGTGELVADALGISIRKAFELRGEPIREPFRIPDKAHLLNRRQRDAVLSVIDAMLDVNAQDATTENQGSNVVRPARWGDDSATPPSIDELGVAADADPDVRK